MHIAEGILPLSHALLWSALGASAVALSARRVSRSLRDDDAPKRALFGMAAALTFAVTLFPIPVPLVGVTSHLCATPVLGLLLGPGRMVVPATLTLLLQALFFAHGGLTSLGANVLTLGVVGPLVAFGVARGLRRLGVPAAWAVGVACALADVTVYVADAAILGLAFAGERPFGAWFALVLAGFAPAQLPLAVLEGVASALFVRAVTRRRPALVPEWARPASRSVGVVPAAIALALALAPRSSAAARAEGYRGLDEAVIEATAAQAGRPAMPLVVFDKGELSLFVWALGSFLAGWAAGSAWRSLEPAKEAEKGRGKAGEDAQSS